MASFAARFRFGNELDALWTTCFAISLCIAMAIIFIFIRVMQHQYCIPQSDHHTKFQPKHITAYSTFTVTFAAISALLTFSMFPVCTEWSCVDTTRGRLYDIFFWFFYTISKLFFYLILIGRLFNPHYAQTHQYPNYVLYVLWLLLVVLMASMIIFNIGSAISMAGFAVPTKVPVAVEIFGVVMYGISDIALSSICCLLFFRPLCQNDWKQPISYPISSKRVLSVARRYGAISALQLVVALVFQMSFFGGYYLKMTVVEWESVWIKYHYIMNVVQISDCMLLMICIYVGFARNIKYSVCPRTVSHSLSMNQ